MEDQRIQYDATIGVRRDSITSQDFFIGSLADLLTQRPASPRRKATSITQTSSPSKSPATATRSQAVKQGQKSSLLRANIIAPPPKISPPLRSSRPRIPVSAATTTSSRAKTIERLSSLQKQNQDPPPSNSRARRLPELQNVDVEARRRQITQAFNKTIRENAQKEKLAADRRRKAREKAQAEEAAQRNGNTRTIRATDAFRRPSSNNVDAPGESEGAAGVFRAAGEEIPVRNISLRGADSTDPDDHAVASFMQDKEATEGSDLGQTLCIPVHAR